MAMMIKDQYRLMTLRCWIGFREDKNSNENNEQGYQAERVVRARLYDGKEAIGGAIDTAFSALGLNPEGLPTPKAPIPDILRTGIAELLRQAETEGPMGAPAAVWLHIPKDSYQLALLPWEEMAQMAIRTPILRIGNFVDDPYRPRLEPTIAICASQPVGDGPYPLAQYVLALCLVIGRAAGFELTSPRICIFADHDRAGEIQALLSGSGFNLPRVEIVSPPEGTQPRPDTEKIDEPGPMSSVWLEWMRTYFSGQTVDIVHFITPGWFAENHGAIALADTPTHNRGGGEFIGASELAAFLDQLGCSAVAFSSPEMPEWEWGQRMLAFELSWLRPGPVLVFEHLAHSYGSLLGMFGLLFGLGPDALELSIDVGSPPQLTCHPQLLTNIRFGDRLQDKIHVDAIGPQEDLLARRLDQVIAQVQPARPLSMAEQWEAAGVAQAVDFVRSLD